LTGNNAITSKQMMRFTFVCQTGIGVINLPALLAKEVGHDGWISVLATGIIAIFLSSLIVVLLRRFSDKCIYDITKLLFGRVAGFIINTLFFIYLIFTTSGGLMVFFGLPKNNFVSAYSIDSYGAFNNSAFHLYGLAGDEDSGAFQNGYNFCICDCHNIYNFAC